MRISGMPETTIDLGQDGEIQISQKWDQLGDQTICFPIELAEKIANEMLRLAGIERVSPDISPFPPPQPFPKD